MASDPKVFWDSKQQVWVCMYVCLGDSSGGHADICIAFSKDLIRWDKEDTPLYVSLSSSACEVAINAPVAYPCRSPPSPTHTPAE